MQCMNYEDPVQTSSSAPEFSREAEFSFLEFLVVLRTDIFGFFLFFFFFCFHEIAHPRLADEEGKYSKKLMFSFSPSFSYGGHILVRLFT